MGRGVIVTLLVDASSKAIAMTLHITVLTHDLIYQSSDLRLLDLATNEVSDDHSGKSVRLMYQGWDGCLTYTGVGRWSDRNDTADMLAQWLDSTGQDSSLDAVASLLARTSTAILSPFKSRGGDARHAFILAAFVDGIAEARIISNFEDGLSQQRLEAADSLGVTRIALRPDRKERVFITGNTRAVDRDQLSMLRALTARQEQSPARIKRFLEQVHLTAFEAKQAANTVSRDCVIHTIAIDGRGKIDVSGMTTAPVEMIMYGSHVNAELPQSGTPGRRTRAVGGSTARSGQPVRTPAVKPCSFGIAVPDEPTGWFLEELHIPELFPSSTWDVNDTGSVIGTAQAGQHEPQEIPWIWRDGQGERLGFRGSALALNDANTVAGTLLLEDGSSHAVSWTDGRLEDLGLSHDQLGFSGVPDSWASAIGSSGLMAGGVRGQMQGQVVPSVRPAIFGEAGIIKLFTDLSTVVEIHSVAINDADQVLLLVIKESAKCAAVLWEPLLNNWDYVGDRDHNVAALSFAADGEVLGQTRDSEGQGVPVVGRVGGDWKNIGLPGGWLS